MRDPAGRGLLDERLLAVASAVVTGPTADGGWKHCIRLETAISERDSHGLASALFASLGTEQLSVMLLHLAFYRNKGMLLDIQKQNTYAWRTL